MNRRLRLALALLLSLSLLALFQNCGRKKSNFNSSSSAGASASALSGSGISDQSATVGQRVEFVVQFDGIPENVLYVWEKDGKPFGSTTSSINFIASVSKEDQGLYKVEVYSGSNLLAQSQARLTVSDAGSSKAQPATVFYLGD